LQEKFQVTAFLLLCYKGKCLLCIKCSQEQILVIAVVLILQ
jgi:hypothetical protein